jgi:hypothetical protein
MDNPTICEDLRRYSFPSPEEHAILRIVLTVDRSNSDAWIRFCQDHPDPRQVLGSLEGRFRRMLAFIHHGLEKNAIELPKAWESYFRIALTRETARAFAYWRQTGEVVRYLQDHGVSCVLIRGAGPALLAYPKDLPRHSHDVDLLVAPGQMAQTKELLEAKRFTPREFVVGGRRRLLGMQHPSELEFVLHSAILGYQGSREDLDTLLPEMIPTPGPADGTVFPVLSPTTCLLHTVHRFYEPPSEKSLYLFMDLFYLTREAHRLDLERFHRLVADRQLHLGCRLALSFLDSIGAPLDATLRTAFETLGATATAREYARAAELLGYDKWRMLKLIARGQGFNRIPLDYLLRRLAARRSCIEG